MVVTNELTGRAIEVDGVERLGFRQDDPPRDRPVHAEDIERIRARGRHVKDALWARYGGVWVPVRRLAEALPE